MSRLLKAAEAMVAKNKVMKRQLADCMSVCSVNCLLLNFDVSYNVRIIVAVIEAGVPPQQLRGYVDTLCHEPNIVMFLASRKPGGGVEIAAGCDYEQAGLGFDCVTWVREAAKIIGGSGGGKAVSAQGGSIDATDLNEMMKVAQAFARENIRS